MFNMFVPQTSSEIHIMYGQPRYPASSTRAVPHTTATERGVHQTSASQTKGNHQYTTRQVQFLDKQNK